MTSFEPVPDDYVKVREEIVKASPQEEVRAAGGNSPQRHRSLCLLCSPLCLCGEFLPYAVSSEDG
jgi:hypothetical protein